MIKQRRHLPLHGRQIDVGKRRLRHGNQLTRAAIFINMDTPTRAVRRDLTLHDVLAALQQQRQHVNRGTIARIAPLHQRPQHRLCGCAVRGLGDRLSRCRCGGKRKRPCGRGRCPLIVRKCRKASRAQIAAAESALCFRHQQRMPKAPRRERPTTGHAPLGSGFETPIGHDQSPNKAFNPPRMASRWASFLASFFCSLAVFGLAALAAAFASFSFCFSSKSVPP